MNHPATSETATSTQGASLEEVDALNHELKKLLSQREIGTGAMREKLEHLERCMDSYRRGMVAAEAISCDGVDSLTQAREQLHLALEEQLRLEDEGGNPANTEQRAYVDQLTAAVRRMDRMIPAVETHFQSTTPNQPTAA